MNFLLGINLKSSSCELLAHPCFAASAYTETVCLAAFSHEKSAALFFAPACCRWRSLESQRSRATACPIVAASSGSTKTAPAPATSASDPPFEQTTAQPQLIASSRGSPNPSYFEPIKNTSAPRYNFAKSAVGTNPVSTTFSTSAAFRREASWNPSGGPTITV